ncbi:MAG: 2-oxoacid:acceptor oxidoreductase family protein [Bacillota bacterium]|jgi:indolepyruvate ferredoxin oxidoreductase beta subunit
MNKSYDIYIVGVGGQGVLTIGELITEAAFKKGIAANFYPTKGMSQRGGFVKAQLRLGQENVGPSIPNQGADLVISMELSETLKALRYAKEGADFLIYGSVWAPTAVMLGKAPYPSVEDVWGEVDKIKGKVAYLDPAKLPEYQGRKVRENIYVLGATLAQTGLKEIFSEEEMISAIKERWPKGAEENIFAFKAGFSTGAISRN